MEAKHSEIEDDEENKTYTWTPEVQLEAEETLTKDTTCLPKSSYSIILFISCD